MTPDPVPFRHDPPPPPSTEDRLLDLLTAAVDRQVLAVERLESSLGSRLEKLDGAVEKLAEGVSGTAATNRVLVAVLVFAGIIVALAQGADVALTWMSPSGETIEVNADQ